MRLIVVIHVINTLVKDEWHRLWIQLQVKISCQIYEFTLAIGYYWSLPWTQDSIQFVGLVKRYIEFPKVFPVRRVLLTGLGVGILAERARVNL